MTFKVHGTLFIMFISSNTYLIGLSRHVTSFPELIIMGFSRRPERRCHRCTSLVEVIICFLTGVG
jgi:hypothetical protein